MKRQLIIVSLLTILSLSIFSQINTKVIDDKSGKEILVGLCDRSGLADDSLGDWFNTEYNSYKPKKKDLRKIKKSLSDDLTITIILATWCSDSRREVPRFIKILDLAGFDSNKLIMYSTDRKKEITNIDTEKFCIQRVPTFIFFVDKNEKGRIIETPKITLEKDFLNIITNQNKL